MNSFYKHISTCIGKNLFEKMEIEERFREFELPNFNCWFIQNLAHVDKS